MKYTDEKGNTYEISYSQKLQREQNRLLAQRNMLIYALLIVIIIFGIVGAWILFRLANSDLLTRLLVALAKIG